MTNLKPSAALLALVTLCGTIAVFGQNRIRKSGPERVSPTEIDTESTYPLLRRRLSVALPGGGCQITWPKKPEPNIQTTYAASYPGSGARMTWNLVEALTGLWTGDDWNNNGRGKDVVTVKTHYPQSNGILPDFDKEITRAFIVIRNPMQSIPSFFNHIYEMRNHLPVHSQRAPVDEWIKWRDHYLDTEIEEYKKFISYWMDRYTEENRLIITYEGLTDDLIGAEVTKGLNDFLGQANGVTPIDRESVPCIWKAVVKNQDPQPVAAPPPSPSRRRLDPAHHDSQRKGPQEPRPYKPEQLEKMMTMLMELASRYQKDVRLYHIMMGYHEKVRTAHAALTPSQPVGGYY